jgi:2-dehydropantoate 2-reductase
MALEPLIVADAVRTFVSLGNGLIQDDLAELVGADRLMAASSSGAPPIWAGPARARHGRAHGRRRARRLPARAHPAARTLPRGVGEVRLSENVRGQIWSKLLVNTAFTGLSAVTGLRYGEVAAHPDAPQWPGRSGRRAWKSEKAEGFSSSPCWGVAPTRWPTRQPPRPRWNG